MSRFLLVLFVLAAAAGVVVTYKDPEQVARASDGDTTALGVPNARMTGGGNLVYRGVDQCRKHGYGAGM